MSTTAEKLKIFQNLLSCLYPLSFTEFDARSFDIISETSKSIEPLYFFMSMPTSVEQWWTPQGADFTSLKADGRFRPIICTNSLGMIWVAEIQQINNAPYHIHCIGPAFVSTHSADAIAEELRRRRITGDLLNAAMDAVQKLPVVNAPRFFEYAIMLHWCLTEERITVSDLMYLNMGEIGRQYQEQTLPSHHASYMAERRMLRAVREGNLQYRREKDRLAYYELPFELTSSDSLRLMRNYVVIFTALCCRAAVEGGLDIETAYSLSDRYIQNTEEAGTLVTLTEISNTMVQDYITRVHRLKTGVLLSPKIQMAVDWIQLAPQNFSVHSLAERLQYSDYYFSKLFRKETGMTVQEYILQQKMEYAKLKLQSTNLSVTQIADELNIHSQSYFACCFRNYTGMTATQYRARSHDKQNHSSKGEENEKASV